MPGPTATTPDPGSAGGDDPDLGRLGSLARGLLRPAPYTRVSVQIDRAGSYTPSTGVTNTIVSVLSKYTHKPVSVAVSHHVGGRSCWTLDDVSNAELANRQVHTGGDAVTLYVLFADGHYCDNESILGVAYRASAMVIFGEASDSLGTPTVPSDRFTGAVATHEIGHIYGLVNIGYHSQIDHEDQTPGPGHANHSSNKQSVMYYEIDSGSLVVEFVKGPPTTFDANDEADLRGLADGTY